MSDSPLFRAAFRPELTRAVEYDFPTELHSAYTEAAQFHSMVVSRTFAEAYPKKTAMQRAKGLILKWATAPW